MDMLTIILVIVFAVLMIWLLPLVISFMASLFGSKTASWGRAFALLLIIAVVGGLFDSLRQSLGISGLSGLCFSLVLIAIEGAIAAALFDISFWPGLLTIISYDIFCIVIALIVIGILVVLGAPIHGGSTFQIMI